MKQLIAPLLSVLLLVTLAACGAGGNVTPQDDVPLVTPPPVTEPPDTEPPASVAPAEDGENPVVYFTSDLTPEGLIAVYEALGWTPTGNVAVKLSTAERHHRGVQYRIRRLPV